MAKLLLEHEKAGRIGLEMAAQATEQDRGWLLFLPSFLDRHRLISLSWN
jgi:hypothetical protein